MSPPSTSGWSANVFRRRRCSPCPSPALCGASALFPGGGDRRAPAQEAACLPLTSPPRAVAGCTTSPARSAASCARPLTQFPRPAQRRAGPLLPAHHLRSDHQRRRGPGRLPGHGRLFPPPRPRRTRPLPMPKATATPTSNAPCTARPCWCSWRTASCASAPGRPSIFAKATAPGGAPSGRNGCPARADPAPPPGARRFSPAAKQAILSFSLRAGRKAALTFPPACEVTYEHAP